MEPHWEGSVPVSLFEKRELAVSVNKSEERKQREQESLLLHSRDDAHLTPLTWEGTLQLV
jgi:hypothetical protein